MFKINKLSMKDKFLNKFFHKEYVEYKNYLIDTLKKKVIKNFERVISETTNLSEGEEIVFKCSFNNEVMTIETSFNILYSENFLSVIVFKFINIVDKLPFTEFENTIVFSIYSNKRDTIVFSGEINPYFVKI